MKKNVVINDLVGYENLKIFQCSEYFNFSLESVLLPNFALLSSKSNKILDLCTGNAPIPMILSTKTKATIYGIELQKEVYDLGILSVEYNKLGNQIKLINDNIKNLEKYFSTDTFDLILCNPPYFKNYKQTEKNENIIKSIARHEIEITLEEIIKTAKVYLKNKSSLVLVHRTDRLIDVITLMRENNIEPKRIQFIYPFNSSESNLFMVEGKKNSKPGLKVDKPLVIHTKNGEYTKEVLKMFRR